MSSTIPNYDLWIKNARILSMDSKFTEYFDSNILIKDGIIQFIGSTASLPNFDYTDVLDASNMIVLPPFFNGHSHAAMSLLRGLGNDVPLSTWLQKYMWPAEKKYINASSVKLGSLISGIEMIRSGTNIFADMYFFEEEVAQAAIELGMRTIIGEGILDFPTPNMKNPDDGINYSRKLFNDFETNPLVSVSIPAHAPYSCSKESLIKVSELSKELQIPATIHLSETSQEVTESLNTNGFTPVEYLDNLGFFDHHAVCYHCNHLSKNDISILRNKQVGVVTLPNSNMKLASGIAPVPDLLAADVCLSLGTDGAASNNNMSILSDMQMLSKLQKIAHSDPTVIDARTSLKLATINGAKTYKMDDQLGSITLGKSADIQFIRIDVPHMQPMYDPYAQIVYSMNNNDVIHLMIDGKFVMKNHEILNVDEERIKFEAKDFAKKLDID